MYETFIHVILHGICITLAIVIVSLLCCDHEYMISISVVLVRSLEWVGCGNLGFRGYLQGVQQNA